MEQLIKLTGIIDRFLFQSSDNGFAIFILASGQTSHIVKGYLPSITAGQEVELEGEWCYHQKFGKQFNAKKCINKIPTTITGLKKYLGSGLIKGIGPTYAEKLVNHFGSEILTIIDTDPQDLMK